MKKHRSLSSLLARGIGVGIALAVVGPLALLPAGCASKTGATGDTAGVKCTAGNYVFCRCQNREEGTKLCNEDGKSFGRCEPCETPDNPGLPDDPDNPPIEFDAGRDVQQPGAAVCGDKIVQDGEDCDDGNKVEDDGCDSSCKLGGTNPIATRSCPGLDLHVWSKPVTYVGTTSGAPSVAQTKTLCKTNPSGTGTYGGNAPERIFKVTAHKTGTMQVVASDTNYDVMMYVAQTCAPPDITYLSCANNIAGVGGETMTFPVTAGQVYSVFMDGAGISQQVGAFRITVSIK